MNTLHNVKQVYSQVYSVTRILCRALGLYILWISLHYIASHLYVYFCTFPSIVGFITSPFLVSTPHCVALRWTIANSADKIQSMWVIIGTCFISSMFFETELKTTETK
jgi:hypothetical protein